MCGATICQVHFWARNLAREVYVKLPEEAGKYAGKIVRCMKALYGLITSSRDFVNSLSERILSFEDNGGRFKKMDTDHCIYVVTDKDGSEMILSHYVDDIICGSNNQELRNRLFKQQSAMEDHERGSSESFRGPEFREIGRWVNLGGFLWTLHRQDS